jgi:hypothetical protein
VAWDTELVSGFVGGLARSGRQGFTAEARARIERDLKDASHRAALHDGLQRGSLDGAWQALTDILKALLLVVERHPAGDVDEWRADPAGKARRELETQERQQTFIEGMPQLVQALTDPGRIAELGGEIGRAAGDYVARYHGRRFIDAGPYEKGRLLGKGIGYVAVEVAMLLLGPELLVAKAPGTVAEIVRAGGKSTRGLLRLMEQIPALRELLRPTLDERPGRTEQGPLASTESPEPPGGDRRGNPGDPDRVEPVRTLEQRARSEFPDDIIVTKRTGGVERRPAVWVEDRQTRAIKKVYETA